MGMWRYKAIPVSGAGALRSGEISGESAADVRAALRHARLQVVELRPLRTIRFPMAHAFHRHACARRRDLKSDLFDSLSTMLESGLPLAESLDALAGSSRRSTRAMLVQLRESVRSGVDLAESMRQFPTWFDGVELALVQAGLHSGELGSILRTISRRHARSGELTQKLVGALAYPTLVACVGVGVVIFLSTKTLPDLIAILDGAHVATPRLTRVVMAVGHGLAAFGPWIALGGLSFSVLAISSLPVLTRRGVRLPKFIRRTTPLVLRRVSVARVAQGLSELLRAGTPAVEALRVIAPAAGGGLRRRLEEAADRLERGDSLVDALDDPYWFDAEFRRLLAVGENAGELDVMLERIGDRYERRSRILIDRLAALLEPAVILVLAALIGIVVMASVLPLLRLQEVV
jgi:type II secretory pathway component PulF